MRQFERFGVDMIVEGKEKGRKDKSLYDPKNEGRSEQLNSFASDNEAVYAGEQTGVAVRFRDPELGYGDAGILFNPDTGHSVDLLKEDAIDEYTSETIMTTVNDVYSFMKTPKKMRALLRLIEKEEIVYEHTRAHTRTHTHPPTYFSLKSTLDTLP